MTARLALSTLAFGRPLGDDDLAAMAALGVTGLELAPLTEWGAWDAIDGAAVGAFAARCVRHGLSVPAMQGLFFGAPVEGVFTPEGPAKIARHLALVGSIARDVGAGVVVFGAPKLRAGGADGDPRAVEAFRRFGDVCAAHGVVLGVEPCPASLGCDLVRTATEGAEFVRRVDHPAVRLHLDCGAMRVAGERLPDVFAAAGALVAHCHLSEPGLGPLAPHATDHVAHAAFLAGAGYAGWVSVEMNKVDEPLAEATAPWRGLATAAPR